jgi:hypothetical protein
MNDAPLVGRERVAAETLARMLRLAFPSDSDSLRHTVAIELVARGSARVFLAGLQRVLGGRGDLDGALKAFRDEIDSAHAQSLRADRDAGLADSEADRTLPGEEVARRMLARGDASDARLEELGPDAWLLEQLADEYRRRAEEASTVDLDAWQYAQQVAERLAAVSASLAHHRQ